MMKKLGFAGALWLTLASASSAYTTYMKPADFLPDNPRVTIETGFATQFFSPVVGLNSPNFAVVMPDGTSSPFMAMNVSAQSSQLDASLPVEGTYKVTTGEVASAVDTLVPGENGSWVRLAQGATPPEGVQTQQFQLVQVADAYVTRGPATRGSVDAATANHLVIHPVTHPNQVLVAQGLQLELKFDGQAFPNFPFVLYAAGDSENKQDSTFVTDAQGRATITVPGPGTYVVVVRHRAPSPDNPTVVREYRTSLTFEAMTELPPMVSTENNNNNNRRPRNRSGRGSLIH